MKAEEFINDVNIDLKFFFLYPEMIWGRKAFSYIDTRSVYDFVDFLFMNRLGYLVTYESMAKSNSRAFNKTQLEHMKTIISDVVEIENINPIAVKAGDIGMTPVYEELFRKLKKDEARYSYLQHIIDEKLVTCEKSFNALLKRYIYILEDAGYRYFGYISYKEKGYPKYELSIIKCSDIRDYTISMSFVSSAILARVAKMFLFKFGIPVFVDEGFSSFCKEDEIDIRPDIVSHMSEFSEGLTKVLFEKAFSNEIIEKL